jgi:exodeoxyribonuclease VII large subunit
MTFASSAELPQQDETERHLRTVWSVSALLRAVSDNLEARFNPIAVGGEITGFSRAASGHCYFSLKDEQGQVRCAMFRRAASLLDFEPANGQKVQLRGRLGVYDQRGELQVIAESLQRAGQGDLFQLFVALKAKLQAEGLFDTGRKRELAVLPKAIGVVTSLGAAALHDVVHALERRVPHIPVVVYPASVQGASAPAELQKALQSAYQRREVDVLLVVRGGGSMEDLWAFNDEGLARTIAESPIPTVTGIGHETDFTIADFCADMRAPTPTAAAELCVQPREVMQGAAELLYVQMQTAVGRYLDLQAQRVDSVATHLARPSHWLTRHDAQLRIIAQYLQQSARSRCAFQTARLDALSESLPRQFIEGVTHQVTRMDRAQFRLAILDPRLVLKRGYAWLADMEGRPVVSAKALRKGEALRATLVDGEVDLTVSAPRLI